jgi:hypothetical protein
MPDRSENANPPAPISGSGSPMTRESAMLASLVHSEDDAEGLLAFALHRRALIDWVQAYRARHGREPDDDALDIFLLGEAAPRRLADYRERAGILLMPSGEASGKPAAATPAGPPAPRKPLRTWFWPWGVSPGFVVENPEQPINWKGLLWRLLMLLGAVVVTALLLRIFVVSGK